MSRLILNMLGRAVMRKISDIAARQTVQVEVTKGELIDDVPRMQNYGLSSVPPAKGTDCLVTFLGGARSEAIVILAENRSVRIKNLEDGDVVIYDNKDNTILLSKGEITVTSAVRTKVIAPMVDLFAGASSVQIDASAVRIISPLLTHNGVDIGATHKHLNSGGQGLGGVPQ